MPGLELAAIIPSYSKDNCYQSKRIFIQTGANVEHGSLGTITSVGNIEWAEKDISWIDLETKFQKLSNLSPQERSQLFAESRAVIAKFRLAGKETANAERGPAWDAQQAANANIWV